MTLNERVADRRKGMISFRIPDRRAGYDRRKLRGAGITSRLNRVLLLGSESARRFFLLLLAINALNVLDLALSVVIFRNTDLYYEGNAFMNQFLSLGIVPAGAFKLGSVLAVSGVFWSLRRYRTIALGTVMTLIVIGTVVIWDTYVFWVVFR